MTARATVEWSDGPGVAWVKIEDGTRLSIRGPRARAWARVLAEVINALPEPQGGEPITWADDRRISADGP